MVVNIETFNACDEKVLEGTAEVAQLTTIYMFTGQGSQEPSMCMDIYNLSPAAHSVWEGMDGILRKDKEQGFMEKDVCVPEKELWHHSSSLSASTSLT